jgi:hypothetical protein
MKKTTLKKVVLSFLCGILGICMIPVIAWFFPFPIEGNWLNPWLISCMCKHERGCHGFLRFEDGKILWMSNTHFPPSWRGTYKRKGWGKYEIEEFGSGDPPSVAYSSCLRMATSGMWLGSRVFRDPFSVCREAVNHPSNDWTALPSATCQRIAGIPENRVFHNGRYGERTKDEMEAMLNGIFRQPLQIYTASNEVPSPVLEVLDEHGVDYTIHANQEWLVPDTTHAYQGWDVPDALRTNPVWTAIEKRTLRGLVITPPFWQYHYGDSRDRDFIYLANEGLLYFEHLRGMIDSHRSSRDDWQKKLRLYVKDGILPEDVRQLFEGFDLEYTVLDEKVLYRGNRHRQDKQ